MSLKVKGFYSRSHRTALVVDVSDYTSAKSDYPERVRRLLQSVNGPNIKADIFALNDGVLTRVSSAQEILDIAKAKMTTYDDASSVREWASDQGYTQVLLNAPAV